MKPPRAPWNESLIIRALGRDFFQRKAVLLVDRCTWTGNECDLLVVDNRLRCIDVEVKISRADFKNDAGKDKWWHQPSYDEARRAGMLGQWAIDRCRTPAEWPRRVWKHYMVLPRELWAPTLLEALPSPRTGVLLISGHPGHPRFESVKRAEPNREAPVLTPAQVLDVARLSNLRLWEAYARLNQLDPPVFRRRLPG